jgi:DNA (cytosine-5)-methyltransferase 1
VINLLEKTVCELFAGVGGFRLGLEHAAKDWKTVWANQWEPGKKLQHAFDCYCAHFGHIPTHVNIDIGEIDKKTIPDHNLLVGGFPCQDYSVAHSLNSARGIEGKKGVLWWQIRDTIEAKQPKFILLENVDRLLKSPASQRGRDFGIMLSCLDQLGYSVEWRVINAAEYGFAQRRRRTFIFGYKNATGYGKSQEHASAQDIIHETGFFATTFPIEQGGKIASIAFETTDLAELSDSFSYTFENAGYMHHGTIYTTKVVPIMKAPILLKDIMEHDVDERFYLGKNLDKWEYMKGAKKIERIAKNGHKYTFSEGPIAFPDPSDRPARTMLTSESTTNRSTHVVEDLDTQQLRLLTPVEAERIQGFDDDWTNTGMPERFRFFCMGNALVVGLVEKMGRTLNRIFEGE